MSRRPSRTAVGREGEEVAARFLAAHGYAVLQRNVRFRAGEIDLVAKEGETLVFVEVKTRTGASFGTPAESVDFRKRQQLVRLASLYIAAHGLSGLPCRFDVVGVEPEAKGGWHCTLYRDAFGA